MRDAPLIARVPGRPNRSHFPEEDFRIDLEAGSCTCPAGQVTRTIVPAGRRTDQMGRTYRLEAFRFDAAVCGACPLRSQCLAAKPGTGRTVRLHPQEALLQQARALQHSEGFAEYRQRRVVVEHRLARLVQLGIRQSRYFGRIKTRFQLYLAATVANLTLVAAKAGLTGETGSGSSAGSALAAGMGNSAANSGAAWLGQIWALILLAAALLPKSLFPTRGFPAGFLGPLTPAAINNIHEGKKLPDHFGVVAGFSDQRYQQHWPVPAGSEPHKICGRILTNDRRMHWP